MARPPRTVSPRTALPRSLGRPAARSAAAVAALVALVEPAVSGCVTVHGENTLLPAVASRGAAAKVLAQFTATSNKANRNADEKLNATNETGVLNAIDQATLKVERAVHPNGEPDYKPLKLTDTHYLIPEQRGWPKWFAADTANNRDHDRWLISFTRDGADQPWKASYLTILKPAKMPKFAMDKDGHAEDVPVQTTELAMPPASVADNYTGYLDSGRPEGFADGPYTSQLRDAREKGKKTDKYVTQYADQAVSARQYPPLALRTADGGALVLFTTQQSWKVTAARGTPPPTSDDYTRELLEGKATKSVTRVGMAEQVALVPKGGGRVEIADRIVGIVSAQGE